MKLDNKGRLIMLFAYLLLLAGCKQKTGMEILTSQMAGLKALKSQYIVHRKGQKDIVVNLAFSKPNRIMITSDDFVVAVNEVDGHFESIFSEKIYDLLPWDGKVYPGTGKLVPLILLEAGPPVANPPSNIVPEAPWKLESKANGIEHYTKTLNGMEGPQTFKLEISEKGEPIRFMVPNDISYEVKKFELVDEIPLEKFRVEPVEGFVSHRTVPDLVSLDTGGPFTWTKFRAASDVDHFKLEGLTMFIFVDPQEKSSVGATNWIKSAGVGYRKVTISKGAATSGFFDPSGQEIDKVTTSTPTFVLVDKSSKIVAMWLGFDPEKVAEFEKDIQNALAGKS
jgi:hypothetical protein